MILFKLNKINVLYFSIVCFFASCSHADTKLNNCTDTLKDSYNRIVILNNKPNRIISAAPSVTEIFFALGKGSLLVGRTNYCKYPAEAAKIPSIGGLEDPSLETIVKINPDLMIASTHFKKENVEQLDALNIPIIVEKEDASFEGVYTMINRIATLLDENKKGDSLINSMKLKISEIEKRVSGVKSRPSVYFVIGFGKTGDYTAGGNTFISEMISMAGGNNIAKDIKGWSFSLEKLIQSDPDIIIIRKGDKELFCNTNMYKKLTAVKTNHVYEVDTDLLELLGPRIADGLQMLVDIVHPEL
jgi:iron complex transport system substrate-binding protein